MKHICILISLVYVLAGCSSRSIDVREIKAELGQYEMPDVKLAFGGGTIQTSSQGDTRIFTLHHSQEEVRKLALNVLSLYGFNLVPEAQADYFLELTKVAPDGGACIEGWDAVSDNMSFTASVLTIGLLPAAGGHCIDVAARLYRNEGERVLVDSFSASQGRVDVLAGENEVDVYRLTVDPRDEEGAIESSIAGLLNKILESGELKPIPRYIY